MVIRAWQVSGMLGKGVRGPYWAAEGALLHHHGFSYLTVWPCRQGLDRPGGTACKETELQHRPVPLPPPLCA